jgi:hypothetical protein
MTAATSVWRQEAHRGLVEEHSYYYMLVGRTHIRSAVRRRCLDLERARGHYGHEPRGTWREGLGIWNGLDHGVQSRGRRVTL